MIGSKNLNKLYLVVISIGALFISSLAVAQSKEQMGAKLADCGGIYTSLYIISHKINAPIQTQNEYVDAAKQTIDISNLFIGKERTSQISSVPIKDTNTKLSSNIPLKPIVDRLMALKKGCDSFIETNTSAINRAITGK